MEESKTIYSLSGHMCWSPLHKNEILYSQHIKYAAGTELWKQLENEIIF